MGGDAYAFCGERGERDRAHGDQGRRDAAAEVAAAAPVLISAVFDVGGIIRVGRTGEAEILAVIRAAGIPVGNEDAERRSGRVPFEDAADDAERVRFPAGGIRQAAGPALGQLCGDEGFVHGDARGETVQDGPDFRSVRLSEKGQYDTGSQTVLHRLLCFWMRSRICSGLSFRNSNRPISSTKTQVISRPDAFLSWTI